MRRQEGQYTREKLETLVRFPLTGLDLSPYVLGPGLSRPAADASAAAGGVGGGGGWRAGPGEGELVYDLYGVVNHFGGSGFGHYTVRRVSPGLWHFMLAPARPGRIAAFPGAEDTGPQPPAPLAPGSAACCWGSSEALARPGRIAVCGVL